MNDYARASLLSIVTLLCATGYPVAGDCAPDDRDSTLTALDLVDMPDMKPLLAEGTEITPAMLSKLGYEAISKDDYEKLFAAPRDVPSLNFASTVVDTLEGTNMFIAVFLLYIVQTGDEQPPGSVAVIAIDGDRFSTTTTPSVAAAPSLWTVGDHGMINEVAPSRGVAGALTQLKYRSADLDYDVCYYDETVTTRFERVMRKATAGGQRTWVMAVQQDGAYYSKSAVVDPGAAEKVETRHNQN